MDSDEKEEPPLSPEVIESQGFEGERGEVMPNEGSAFSRARTVDPLIKSPQACFCNSLQTINCGDSVIALAPFLAPAAIPLGSLADPDLIHVIRAWDKIPENMRAVIKSMAALALPLEGLNPPNNLDERLARQAKT